MRRLIAPLSLFAAVIVGAAVPANAGGRGTIVCPAGYVGARDAQARPICVAGTRSETVAVTTATVIEGSGRRGVRLFCPYPYRPSDSVFSGGSGYIIKNDVRRALGCF